MKKIFLFLCSFFLFNSFVFAAETIDAISVDVKIDESGYAQVEETWLLPKQNNKTFTKKFKNMHDVVLENVQVRIGENVLENVDSIKRKEFVYSYKEKNTQADIRFSTNGEETQVVLSYGVSGMLTQFRDGIGIDWNFFTANEKQSVGSIIITITGATAFNEINTALYAIGTNLNYSFQDGNIILSSSTLTSESNISLLTSFVEMPFSTVRTVNRTINEQYNYLLKKASTFDKMKEFLFNETLLVSLSILGILFLLFFLPFLIYGKNKDSEYKNISLLTHQAIDSMDIVPYYDIVPFDRNIYKISFLAKYFHIIKNPSNLIGAFLLKWIYEGKASIKEENNRTYYMLKENMKFKDALEESLYSTCLEASSSCKLDKGKILRFCKKNPERIHKWFIAADTFSLTVDYQNGNLKRIDKFGKVKLVLSAQVYDDVRKIQGLKKYLLNFNQVPRQHELTESEYMNLLVSSVLLGISSSVSKEIIRKNPGNKLAKQLILFDKEKPLYKGIYDTVMENLSKQTRKSGNFDINK